MKAWSTIVLDVRNNEAFRKASLAPRRHFDKSFFLLSPKDFSMSAAGRETNAMQ
jgi:hypothetical protein